jgi:hypothetical protein
MFVPHRKDTYGSARHIAGIALHFHMKIMFVPHGKHIYWSPRAIAGIDLFFFYFYTSGQLKRYNDDTSLNLSSTGLRYPSGSDSRHLKQLNYG